MTRSSLDLQPLTGKPIPCFQAAACWNRTSQPDLVAGSQRPFSTSPSWRSSRTRHLYRRHLLIRIPSSPIRPSKANKRGMSINVSLVRCKLSAQGC